MRALVGTAVLLLALAGCGGDDDDADEGEVPACADLAGETITDDFEGCMEGDELQAVSGAYDCLEGRTLNVVGKEPSEEPSEEATEEPSEEPTSGSGSTDCADVWIEGANLPADYDGCQEGGKRVLAAIFECTDGPGLTGYDERLYAFLGGEIMPTSDGDAYAAAFADCLG